MMSMRIRIDCECGNKIDCMVPKGKYIQARDNLEAHRFRYVGEEIQGQQLMSIRVSCDKCNNWLVLGFD